MKPDISFSIDGVPTFFAASSGSWRLRHARCFVHELQSLDDEVADGEPWLSGDPASRPCR